MQAINQGLSLKRARMGNSFSLQTFFSSLFSSMQRAERVVLLFCIGSSLLSLVLLHINPIHYKYAYLFNNSYILAIEAYLAFMLVASAYLRNFMSEKFTSILIICFLTILPLLSGWMGEGPIMLTPFHAVDIHILHFDQLLGVNVGAIMSYTHRFPIFVKLLLAAYNSLLFQMMLFPLLLTICGHFKHAQRLVIAMSIGAITAGAIYYFFPTTGPISVIHNQYFEPSSAQLVQRFYDVHHQILPTVLHAVGLIAFPSCHVMFCTLATLFVVRIRIMRPFVIIVNILLVIATMALGYHFFADVLGGASLAVACFWLSKKLV